MLNATRCVLVGADVKSRDGRTAARLMQTAPKRWHVEGFKVDEAVRGQKWMFVSVFAAYFTSSERAMKAAVRWADARVIPRTYKPRKQA